MLIQILFGIFSFQIIQASLYALIAQHSGHMVDKEVEVDLAFNAINVVCQEQNLNKVPLRKLESLKFASAKINEFQINEIITDHEFFSNLSP